MSYVRILFFFFLFSSFVPIFAFSQEYSSLTSELERSAELCEECEESVQEQTALIGPVEYRGGFGLLDALDLEAFLLKLLAEMGQAFKELKEKAKKFEPCGSHCQEDALFRYNAWVQFNGNIDPWDESCSKTISKSVTISAWGATCEIARLTGLMEARTVLNDLDKLCKEEAGEECTLAQVHRADLFENSEEAKRMILWPKDEPQLVGCRATWNYDIDLLCAKGQADFDAGAYYVGTIDFLYVCSDKEGTV